MKKYLLPLLTILILLSCNNKTTANTQSVANSDWRLDSIAFNERIHIDNDTLRDGMVLDIFCQYPQSAPAGFSLEKIRQSIAQVFTGDTNFKGSIHDAFDQVKDAYTAEAMELGRGFSDMEEEFGSSISSFSNYEQSRRLEIDAIYNSLLTLNSHSYAYTGGAHGYGATSFYHIDLKDGKVVSDTILFGQENLEKVGKLLQEEVQRRNEDEDSEYYISLLVKVEEIEANNNFSFIKEGISYLYNQYEIAPYAQGPVEIVVSYDKILPLVSQSHRKAVEEIQVYNFPNHEIFD